MQQRSIYIKGEKSGCLVKVPDVGHPALISDLAYDKAKTLGILPDGELTAYTVPDEQDESFYDRVIEWD